jgi:hypothetical protein
MTRMILTLLVSANIFRRALWLDCLLPLQLMMLTLIFLLLLLLLAWLMMLLLLLLLSPRLLAAPCPSAAECQLCSE